MLEQGSAVPPACPPTGCLFSMIRLCPACKLCWPAIVFNPLAGSAGSTCSRRVITALEEKGLPYELVTIDLIKGEQKVRFCQPLSMRTHCGQTKMASKLNLLCCMHYRVLHIWPGSHLELSRLLRTGTSTFLKAGPSCVTLPLHVSDAHGLSLCSQTPSNFMCRGHVHNLM